MIGIAVQNIEPDVELNRRITPEIRPEDFPPGVAYLPDGDDDDFDEEDFNSKSNNKIDFASTIKTVKNVIITIFSCQKQGLVLFR